MKFILSSGVEIEKQVSELFIATFKSLKKNEEDQLDKLFDTLTICEYLEIKELLL